MDWDGDGVLDSDENKPASFMEQVWEHQCSLDPNLTEGSAFSLDYIDGYELDEDETPGFSAILNIGGHSGPEGEEALLTTSVLGGQQYIVVVSGGGDSGTYELSLRQTNY